MPYIREQLDRMDIHVPLIGDFHYNGHRLLADHPACAEALSKYRINPGNVGKGDKRDRQFGQMVEIAARLDKVVRIGVNWGSLDQELLAQMMDENGRRAEPFAPQQVMYQAIVDVGARIGALRRGDRPRRGQHRPVLQDVGRAGSGERVSRARAPMRLRAAPRPDRSRHGHQGHGRLDRRARAAAAGGHRRHDPRLAHAATRRAAHAGSGDRARDPAIARPALVQPECHRLSGLRAHDEHDLPGTCQADRRLPARADADLDRRATRASRR